MKYRFLFLLALVALIAAPAALEAQSAWVYGSSNPVYLINPQAATIVKTISFPVNQSSRGHCMGYDGSVYFSWWSTNAIGRYGPSGAWTTLAQDPTNKLVGAPYVPCPDFEAVGGPGLWAIDGNSYATTPTTLRNSVLVDIGAGTAKLDALFPSTYVPMADCYPSPYKPGHFVGVGFATSDYNVVELKRHGTVTTVMTPAVIGKLKLPCGYDAFIHEDNMLYCWTNSFQTPATLTGFEVMDLKTGATKFMPLKGIAQSALGYAAVWNDPWDKPGKIAYIANDVDDTLYVVDLATGAVKSIMKLPVGTYNNAREIEEAQLGSWRAVKTKTDRVFTVNFGQTYGGWSYVLAPSITGLAGKPIVSSGVEIWLQPDSITFGWLLGFFGHVPSGILSKSGTDTKVVDFNKSFGITTWWQAVCYMPGKGIVDASNIICVTL